MISDMSLWLKLLLAMAFAAAVSFMMTPPVKRFAEKVGAIDIPKDERRVHDHPIPRMGGLAIFIGFVLSLLIFVDVSTPVLGILLGALIIVVMGAIDDIVNLNAWVKLAGQIVAAVVAIRCGIVFDAISNPNAFSEQTTIVLANYLPVPLTLLWIVGCTNAVNLIDGLDGLAVGVSTISSLTMLVVAMFVAEPSVAVILAALTGACLGFIPYNFNPAKIFMGDSGSQFLGFMLAGISVIGAVKSAATIALIVPILALGLPILDTTFAIVRRYRGGVPIFKPDKGHLHHRLLDLGFSQRQAVLLMYVISALLGLSAVALTEVSTQIAIAIVCVVVAVVLFGAKKLGIFHMKDSAHQH